MLIYANVITARLNYIAEFAGKLILGKGFDVTSDKNDFLQAQGARINYSTDAFDDGSLHIIPHTILFEKGITGREVQCDVVENVKVIFRTEGEFPFDVFAAAFYLIARYEEYLPHTKDQYGRFAHENSLAFKEGFLEEPLVNRWIGMLATAISKKFPATAILPKAFQLLPTYDIDMAWSYLHKGSMRTAGGLLKFFLSGKWRVLGERIAVLRGRRKDPFDAYGWLNGLHERYQLKPYYFFLMASQTGRYDRNVRPDHPAMRSLIADHVIRYPVGIHPSWRSGDDHSLLAREMKSLAAATGTKVSASRQHYIRFTLPETFRRLIDAGIGFDFSMGYGSINGFRASVASPYNWYDLEKEERTELVLFPFCYMEANSFYEQKLSATQALDEMRHYERVIGECGGIFIMIWHNSFLGSDKATNEWKAMYESFYKERSH